jgi:sugar phosphate isomerase/epimerase
MSLEGLEPRSLAQIADAGYDGVQFVEELRDEEAAECERLGLGRCGLGRVNAPGEADELARRLAGEGMECGTVHVGWGMESAAEADALIEAILEASAVRRIPIFVETHRATLFQDMWRTVELVKRHPGLRFNGDFSHWYTGLEMVYGGFETKLEYIAPVTERVRFMHGRIGNPGCMQVDVGDGSGEGRPFVGHFRALWTASFHGFIRCGEAETILFVPELLSPRIYYGREFGGREECDRWDQCLVLRRIALECFAAARSDAAGD